jgi:hypothetical protein
MRKSKKADNRPAKEVYKKPQVEVQNVILEQVRIDTALFEGDEQLEVGVDKEQENESEKKREKHE